MPFEGVGGGIRSVGVSYESVKVVTLKSVYNLPLNSHNDQYMMTLMTLMLMLTMMLKPMLLMSVTRKV